MPDNFEFLTPEECLYQDVLTAVQRAEEADIEFHEIRRLILLHIDGMDPKKSDNDVSRPDRSLSQDWSSLKKEEDN